MPRSSMLCSHASAWADFSSEQLAAAAFKLGLIAAAASCCTPEDFSSNPPKLWISSQSELGGFFRRSVADFSAEWIRVPIGAFSSACSLDQDDKASSNGRSADNGYTSSVSGLGRMRKARTRLQASTFGRNSNVPWAAFKSTNPNSTSGRNANRSSLSALHPSRLAQESIRTSALTLCLSNVSSTNNPARSRSVGRRS